MKKIVTALMVAGLMVGCGRIETGNVGVRTDFNKNIESTEMNPGFYTSFFTNVDEFTTKESEIAMNDMRPKAKDNLSLQDLDVSVFYKTAGTAVAEQLIKYQGMAGYDEASGTYRPGYFLVERVIRGAIYDAVSAYDSLTIHTKRNELEKNVMDRVQKDLDASDKGVFTITKVVVRQILTDPALEASIRANVQMQKQVEAKNAELALAEAEARRKIVEARGEATANEIIANSITPNLIKLREIEMTGQFAKEGTHTVLMQPGTNALVGVK